MMTNFQNKVGLEIGGPTCKTTNSEVERHVGAVHLHPTSYHEFPGKSSGKAIIKKITTELIC